jgi:hypothetical protein
MDLAMRCGQFVLVAILCVCVINAIIVFGLVAKNESCMDLAIHYDCIGNNVNCAMLFDCV